MFLCFVDIQHKPQHHRTNLVTMKVWNHMQPNFVFMFLLSVNNSESEKDICLHVLYLSMLVTQNFSTTVYVALWHDTVDVEYLLQNLWLFSHDVPFMKVLQVDTFCLTEHISHMHCEAFCSHKTSRTTNVKDTAILWAIVPTQIETTFSCCMGFDHSTSLHLGGACGRSC